MKSLFIKKFKLLIGLFIISFISLAQSPESMNYQAVMRNSSGTIIANQSVGIRIKILQGSANGSAVYNETFNPTTNAYGMVSLQIGTGSVVSGTFSSIDWGNNSYFVETAADILGGSNYSVISTTQFMSVPYALYAKSAGSSPADNDWTESGNNIFRSSGNVGIGTTNPSSKLDVNGTGSFTGDLISGGDITTGNNGKLILWRGGIQDPYIRHVSNKSIGFFTVDSEKMRIAEGGNVGISTTNPSSKLDVNGDINLTGDLKINGVAQTFGGSSGLEQITENGNTGFRLTGSDPNNFGDIGANSTDLSTQDEASSTRGATAPNAFAAGRRTTASGWHATALGSNSVASGDNSIAVIGGTASGSSSNAIGVQTIASGQFSTSIGVGATASGERSTAIGSNVTASANRSTAIGGDGTIASGDHSLAMGQGNIASGNNSVAIGDATTASGNISTSMGYITQATGGISTAMGGNTQATAFASTAMGNETKANGAYSTSMGRHSTASASYSTAMGFDTDAESAGCLAIGRYNIGGGNPTTWDSNDPAFEIGNGVNASNRSNAFQVLQNGNTTINGQLTLSDRSSSITFPNSDGSSGQVLQTNGSGTLSWSSISIGGSSGLEQITENGNNGFRLTGSDPNNFGDIGANSTDLSTQTQASTTRGATGLYSLASGENTTASSYRSTAMGNNTIASNENSTAMGINTNASGNSSTAMGNSTTASGTNSIAMGSNNTASGTSSTAMGRGTVASGSYSTSLGELSTASGSRSLAAGQHASATAANSIAIGHAATASGYGSIALGGEGNESAGLYSTAMGRYTKAHSVGELTIGSFNTNYNPVGGASTWDALDRLFVIGNGTSQNSRSNAFLVLKNGNTTINGQLNVNGNIFASGAIISQSDVRYKQNINSLDNALEKVLKLRGVSYNFKVEEYSSKKFPADTQIGFIAQELLEIYPQLISKDKEGYYSVDYSKILSNIS